VDDNTQTTLLIDSFFISKCNAWEALYFAHILDNVSFRTSFYEFREEMRGLPFTKLRHCLSDDVKCRGIPNEMIDEYRMKKLEARLNPFVNTENVSEGEINEKKEDDTASENGTITNTGNESEGEINEEKEDDTASENDSEGEGSEMEENGNFLDIDCC